MNFQSTHLLLEMAQEKKVLSEQLVDLAGRAADELALFSGQINGTYDGYGAVKINRFGLLFIEDYDTPSGKLPMISHVSSRGPRTSRLITAYMQPDQEYIIAGKKGQAAPESLYIEFAQNIEVIVEKIAEKQEIDLQKLRSTLKTVKQYLNALE